MDQKSTSPCRRLSLHREPLRRRNLASVAWGRKVRRSDQRSCLSIDRPARSNQAPPLHTSAKPNTYFVLDVKGYVNKFLEKNSLAAGHSIADCGLVRRSLVTCVASGEAGWRRRIADSWFVAKKQKNRKTEKNRDRYLINACVNVSAGLDLLLCL